MASVVRVPVGDQHTLRSGVVAAGQQQLGEVLAVLGEAAAGAVQAAIVSAVVGADSAFGVTAWRDLVER